jgi:hypothetical protein
MMDDLKQTLDIALKKMHEVGTENSKSFIRYWLSPQGEFELAILALAKGDATKLIECLRSDRPIEFDRKQLARLLEQAKTAAARPRGGPHYHRGIHSAAALALALYKMWQEENLRRGVKDRGCSEYMKDEAAKVILDQKLLSQQIISRAKARKLSADDFSAIRDLMDRPAKRLKVRSS